MKQQCPRCGQFKFEKIWSRRGCGLFLMFGVPLFSLFFVPGASSFYGGNTSVEDMTLLILVSFIIGIIIFIFSLISPEKTITFKCSNCDFQETYNK